VSGRRKRFRGIMWSKGREITIIPMKPRSGYGNLSKEKNGEPESPTGLKGTTHGSLIEPLGTKEE